ncbi:hypothetical protein LINGRAPRIM_LOCUS1784 [Linum grandiflorum]
MAKHKKIRSSKRLRQQGPESISNPEPENISNASETHISESISEKENVDSNSHGSPTNPPNVENSMRSSDGNCSQAGSVKRKGRGKGKGVQPGKKMKMELYDSRIISPKVVREITILFNHNINGPWTTYSQYPEDELNALYARFKDAGFECSLPENEIEKAVKDYVKFRFSDWMYTLRHGVFSKYKSLKDRYEHPPENITPTIWRQMVDKWSTDKWAEKSVQNKDNRSNSGLKGTGGSIPMAKFRADKKKKDGVEPSPIDLWEKFHMKKDKTWSTEKAETMHNDMKARQVASIDEGVIPNDWDIYHDVIGKPKHGRVLGMGVGVKVTDVFGYSSASGCSKRCEEERIKEKEKTDALLKNTQDKLTELQNSLPNMVRDMLLQLGVQIPGTAMKENNNTDDEDEDLVAGNDSDEDDQDDESDDE